MADDTNPTIALDVPSVLRGTAILRDVSERTISRIAAIARPESIDEGDTLYAVGDPARNVYVVARGRLRFTLGGDGQPATSGAIVPPGDILGWAALLVDQPRRIATVAALEQSLILEIEGTLLLTALEDDPRAGFLVMQRLARRITQSFLEQSRLLAGAT